MGEKFFSDHRTETATVAPIARRARLAALLSALSATILVFSELVAFDAAFVWVVENRIGTTVPVVWGTAAVGLVVALYVAFRFFRVGYENELDLSTTGDDKHLRDA